MPPLVGGVQLEDGGLETVVERKVKGGRSETMTVRGDQNPLWTQGALPPWATGPWAVGLKNKKTILLTEDGGMENLLFTIF
uniref:Uncharacterized protein n=1 Tax=Oryza nivara TaxID=4536 RepID=A0A0E0FL45_ORYNI